MRTALHRLSLENSSFTSKFQFYAFGLLCILLLAKAVVFFVRASWVISYPFEWSTMDGYFVFHGLRLISSQPIYFNYETILTPMEYVPLYIAVIGVLAKVFGPAVWYERCFSILCAICIAGLVGRAVWKRTDNRIAAVCAFLLFFVPAPISVWYIVRGIDIFAALLGLLGVVIIAESDGSNNLRIMAASAIFVLAFYAKQTAVFPMGAGVVYIFLLRPKKGFLMGAGIGIFIVIVFAALQMLTNGWFYDNAFVTTSRNPFVLKWLIGFLKAYSFCLFVALPLAFLQAFRGISRRPDIWTLYFLFTLLSAMLAGKAGAALSYFVPLFSATCICVGLFLGDADLAMKRVSLFSIALGLMVIQALSFYSEFIPVPSRSDYEQAMLLDSYIKENPGPILTERIDSFAVNNGRELNIEAVQLPILIMRRKFDPDILNRELRKRTFSLIAYSGVYFGGSPAVKNSIFENYVIENSVKIGLFYGKTEFLVLVPKREVPQA